MTVAGNPLSRSKECRPYIDNAYVNEGDIPQHVIDGLNESWKSVDAKTEVAPQHLGSDFSEGPSQPEIREINNNETIKDFNIDGFDLCSSPNSSPCCSIFEPDRSSPESLAELKPYATKVGETKKALLGQYFLVEGEQLLQLFRFCPSCGTRLTKAELTAAGTAPVVRFLCPLCSLHAPYVSRWEGQKRAVEHSREKMFKGNVAACVSLITTGERFVAGESLHLAADGAYDSRGYSALIGKVVLSDTLTKLILRTEVLHRSETAHNLRVASLTTDRSKAVGKLLKDMEGDIGCVDHYYDGWHLVKWLGNELLKRDLARASPYGGTSICETKNALDRLYCRKEIFYPVSTYHLYAKLATMHLNTLRLAEMAGERNVIRTVEVQRKYNRRKSTIYFKNPVAHKWRDDILDEVFSSRLLFLNSGANDEDVQISEDIQEMMDAEEIYSAEL
ncbi:hypothetical protein OESDEN_10033 [Oesophagostomum dentatum]|uniref:Uncharacterized protein n=1 Tax=Oesophagostomum dentatum TaxID=61180 RepID=A0A0B1T2Z7_OESDE|nr:hypothetical protein OESDEN_10033 [Oesophagostomum dentatum]